MLRVCCSVTCVLQCYVCVAVLRVCCSVTYVLQSYVCFAVLRVCCSVTCVLQCFVCVAVLLQYTKPTLNIIDLHPPGKLPNYLSLNGIAGTIVL